MFRVEATVTFTFKKRTVVNPREITKALNDADWVQPWELRNGRGEKIGFLRWQSKPQPQKKNVGVRTFVVEVRAPEYLRGSQLAAYCNYLNAVAATIIECAAIRGLMSVTPLAKYVWEGNTHTSV